MDCIRFYESNTVEIKRHYDELKRIIEASGVAPEGNCLYIHNSLNEYPVLINKRANLLSLAQKRNKIAEIGFNAGHSAVLLALPNNAEITFFDIVEHPYVEPCFAYCRAAFPNKMNLIRGNSMQTLPAYVASHSEPEFDLVHVDGGHSEACFSNDFACAFRMAKPGAIIVVDDTNVDYITKGVDAAIAAGKVEEIKDVLWTMGYEHRVVRKRV